MAAAMSGTLLVGGCSKGPNTYGPPEMAGTLSEVSVFAERYAGYWQGAGAGPIKISRVVALGSDEEYRCEAVAGSVVKMRSDTIAAICVNAGLVATGDIVLGNDGLSAFNAESERLGFAPKTANEFTVAHEIAHLVQMASGFFKNNTNSADYERQADCLAGKSVASVNPSLVGAAMGYYTSHMDNSIGAKTHGPWVLRGKAFVKGATGGTC